MAKHICLENFEKIEIFEAVLIKLTLIEGGGRCRVSKYPTQHFEERVRLTPFSTRLSISESKLIFDKYPVSLSTGFPNEHLLVQGY